MTEATKPTRTITPGPLFVKTWQTAALNAKSGEVDTSKPFTVQTVADALGIGYGSVVARKKALEAKGVEFFDMPRAPKPSADVEALKALAASFREDEAETESE